MLFDLPLNSVLFVQAAINVFRDLVVTVLGDANIAQGNQVKNKGSKCTLILIVNILGKNEFNSCQCTC